MKKIGIITTSNAINYGAVLQAYALRETIDDLTDEVVEIIDYCGNPILSGRNIYRSGKKMTWLINNLLIFLNVGYRSSKRKLIESFDEFKKDKLKINGEVLKNKKEVENVLNLYSTLICGSDQIWNLNLVCDDVYFLNFHSNFPKISYNAYSASIAEKMSSEQEKYIISSIGHFNKISVREKKMAEHLKKISGMDIQTTIDPVFLLTKEQWNKAIGESKIHILGDYVLIFMISHAKSDNKIIDRICKFQTNLKKVVINLHPFNYCKGDVYIRTASPEQFLELIKNASLIITDSFHATSFSIIFNKTFYNIRRSNRNSRIENLYSVLEIPNRYVDKEVQNEYLSELDYAKINEKIGKERFRSYEYLKKIVEG